MKVSTATRGGVVEYGAVPVTRGVGETFGFLLGAHVFRTDDNDRDRGILQAVFADAAGEEAGDAAEGTTARADNERGRCVYVDLSHG